jgi:hypothetical protein
MKQAREIMWASKRMQNFGPWDWIESVNDTEMRVRFNNGSFIKLEGSDNDQALRGIKPRGLVIYDEYKDFRPQFHEAMDPNRAAHKAPLLVIGTPPEFENHFSVMQREFQNDPRKKFFRFPTSANPHIDREWLERKKLELYSRGDGDEWEREYMALDVKGGSSRIFPMLSDSHVQGHAQLMASLVRDRKKLQYFVFADPAASSVFAVLFAAINPYTRAIYILDEIYETAQSEMTVKQIGTRIVNKVRELDPRESYDWRYGYDEAASWFRNEMLDHFDIGFEPTQKAKADKVSGLTMIKDALLVPGRFIMSERCRKLYWEMDNYRKDENGKIAKVNDHAIDCLRYILDADHYTAKTQREERKEDDPMWRGARINDDFPQFNETGESLDDFEEWD